MQYVLPLVASLTILAQSAPTAPAPTTKSAGVEPAGSQGATSPSATAPGGPTLANPSSAARTKPASPAAGKSATPPETPLEPETDADRFIKASADKIDGIQWISADVHEVIRIADRFIESRGVFLRGPGNKVRFELDVDLGDAAGKRIVVSDGKIGYRYKKVLDGEDLFMVKLDQILPVLDKKDLTQADRRRVLADLPLVEPGEMLRGYLNTVTFTDMSDQPFGSDQRKAVLLNGHWRKRALDALVGRQNSDLEQVGAVLPQFIRLYVDKESGFPLKIELYRKDKSAEIRPVFSIEFTKVTLGKSIEDARFAFKIPEKLVPQDLTNEWLNLLKTVKDKGAASAPSAAAKSAAGAVSAPIQRVPSKSSSNQPSKDAPKADAPPAKSSP